LGGGGTAPPHADVVALATEPLEAAVQVFYVRGGRVRGQRGWVVDRVDDAEAGELMERFLQQLYGGIDGTAAVPPREVLVSAAPDDSEAVGEWLGGLRGTRVRVRVPRRGPKAQLMQTVAKNAEQTLQRHKSKRSSDLTTRSQALNEIAEALGLEQAPLRIECYDISELQGSNVVGSMVVFEDGLARKSEYRRFSVRGLQGKGDVAALSEVLTRRFRRYLEQGSAQGELVGAQHPAGPAPGEDTAGPDDRARTHGAEQGAAKFAYPPNLVVVDGGRPQVEAARRALDALGIDDIAVCGLAKRLEEVWLPGEEDPVILPRSSEGLYLLQRVRDEAHRFAITYHRGKRGAAAAGSALDGIEGVGPARRAALLKHFGSLRRLSQATAQDIAAVPGIGASTAEAIVRRLRPEEGRGEEPEGGSAGSAGR
jgi:excinuclease ABC subunit C